MSELTPGDLQPDTVRAHVADLGRAGEARSSVARKVSALRTFVRYLRREGALADRARGREQRAISAEHDQQIDALRDLFQRFALAADPARGLAVEHHLDAAVVQPLFERGDALGHLRLVALHAYADDLELHAGSITRC